MRLIIVSLFPTLWALICGASFTKLTHLLPHLVCVSVLARSLLIIHFRDPLSRTLQISALGHDNFLKFLTFIGICGCDLIKRDSCLFILNLAHHFWYIALVIFEQERAKSVIRVDN